MPDSAEERVAYPFTAFNFSVEINTSGGKELLCAAAFSDCDGLEMTMDVKTIREGGNNGKQIRLTGRFQLRAGNTQARHDFQLRSVGLGQRDTRQSKPACRRADRFAWSGREDRTGWFCPVALFADEAQSAGVECQRRNGGD